MSAVAQLLKLADVEVTSITINADGTFIGTWKPTPAQMVESEETERWIDPDDITAAAQESGLNSGVATRAFHALTLLNTSDKPAREFFKQALRTQGYSVELRSLTEAMRQPNFDGYYLSLRNVGGACLAMLREVVGHLSSQPAG